MNAQRIVVAGGPLCGKSTYAHALGRQLGIPVLHTDTRELHRLSGSCSPTCRFTPAGLDWSATSAAVARWFSNPGPWIVDGVAAARALRKWLEANRIGRPCDIAVCMRRALVPLNPGQVAMTKGCDKVWGEIVAVLAARGVRFDAPQVR